MKRNVKAGYGDLTDREAAWITIRDMIHFTREDVERIADVHTETASSVIQDLRSAGLVETVGREGYLARYELVQMPDDAIPPIISKRVLAWRQQVWNALRIARCDALPGIMASLYGVDVAEGTIARYLRRLELAGYVRKAGRMAKEGRPMSYTSYRIMPDVGPVAPTRQQLLQTIEERSDDS